MTTGKLRDEKLKTELIAKFQQFAAREGGVPGIRAFVEETGVKKHLWDGSLWPSWRAFLEDAGFKSNELTQAIPDEKMLRPLALLTRQFRRFPTVRELKYAHTSDATFLAGEKTYRNRFKNRAGMISGLREWIVNNPEYADVLPLLEDEPSKAPANDPVAEPATSPRASLSESFVPPVVDSLTALAIGDDAILAACEAAGTEPSVEFERRVGMALRLLGLDVKPLGQGAGRVADGIACCRPARWAVLYDAKLRRGGFSMQTEDRKFREYIERHGRELARDGIDAIYFAVVSSSFDERDVGRAQEIVHATKAKAVVLLEAAALRAMVDLKLRTAVLDEWTELQKLFGVTRIITAKDVEHLEE